MKTLYLLLSLIFLSFNLYAQDKKVLLEEYCGAHCGQCPLGSYYTDSMETLFPGLISVALHAYSPPDAMAFPQIDTLYRTFSSGAPLGSIDRINTGTVSNNTSIIWTQWQTRIQQQLSVSPQLTIDLQSSWNSVTRSIAVHVTVNIVSNMPSGDYRLAMYIVEDSVTGTGSGYDQANVYNGQIGSPFFGLGNPIVGYVHRHVARAILPSSWGLQGLIGSQPSAGQIFTHDFDYSLPASYNENRIMLVAFVNKITPNHLNDNVFNSSEIKLTSIPTNISNNSLETSETFTLEQNFPNPFNPVTKIKFDIPSNVKSQTSNVELIVYDVLGNEVETLVNEKLNAGSYSIDFNAGNLSSGIYFYKLIAGNYSETKRMILLK